MQALQNNEVPPAAKKRLIQLHSVLKGFEKERITSQEIKALTGWTDSTIRHDFWLIGFGKGASNGYKTEELKTEISRYFGLEEEAFQEAKKLCIVGLNRLGAALLDEGFFEGSGFVIKAGFDSNLYRVEILRSTFPLYPATQMEFVIKKEGIEYAVLTSDAKNAQMLAEKLANAGIRGIVNMTCSVLKVPPEVKVEDISILNALKLIR